jgi:hypothetical protein
MPRALWEIVPAGMIEVDDMVSRQPIHDNYPRVVRIRRQGDEIRLDYANGEQEDATRLTLFYRLVKEKPQPAPNADAFERHVGNNTALLRAIHEHGLDSAQATAARDVLDATWYCLTEAQQELIGGINELVDAVAAGAPLLPEVQIDTLRRASEFMTVFLDSQPKPKGEKKK